jgi:hypothetical protein
MATWMDGLPGYEVKPFTPTPVPDANAIKAGVGKLKPSALNRVSQGIQASRGITPGVAGVPSSAVAPASFLSKALKVAASPISLGLQAMAYSPEANAGEDAMFAPGGKFSAMPAPADGVQPAPQAPHAPVRAAPVPVDPAAQPAAVLNPSTPEQQQFLRQNGITSDKVVNSGAGVPYSAAQTIQRQGRYAGPGGSVYQLSGLGDQNSIYAGASKPGGKLDTFTGAGTGKASTPGSFAGNVVPAGAITAPDTGLTDQLRQSLNAAADRGDWKAIQKHYANKGEAFNGKAPPLPYSPGVMKALAEIEAFKAKAASDTTTAKATADHYKNADAANWIKANKDAQLIQGQVEDSAAVRKARQAYSDAIDRNDAAAIKNARNKLVGLGALTDPKSGNPTLHVPSLPGSPSQVFDPSTMTVFTLPVDEKGKVTATSVGQASAPAGTAPGNRLQNVTPADITATAKKYGISESEVKRQLGI